MATVIQFTVFGVPSIYYGDEIGLEGYHDPFCRMPYPWGREDKELLRFYTRLGKIRATCGVFRDGEFAIEHVEGGFIAYSRKTDKEKIVVAVNRSDRDVAFHKRSFGEELLSGEKFDGVVKANTAVIIKEKI